MKKFFKWFGIVFGTLVLAIGVFLVGMRFSDGPIEIFTGGPFSTGTPAAAPTDWTYLTDRDLIVSNHGSTSLSNSLVGST